MPPSPRPSPPRRRLALASLTRAALTGAALTGAALTGVALTLLSACGVATGTSTADDVPLAPPAPSTPAGGLPSGWPSAAGARRSTAVSAASAPAASGASGDFATGLAAYCTIFYTQQRDNEDQHPTDDAATLLAYAGGQVATSQQTQTTLVALRPPAGLRAAFDAFVANARQILEDRQADLAALRAGGDDSAQTAALDADFRARWPLATQLGASGCDGQLPAAQQTAVIAAVRAFETATDSDLACRSLTTPGYLRAGWPAVADPGAGCIADRETVRLSTVGLPSDIAVQSVTGSDGIAGTVHYTFVGSGCGCGEQIARLHDVDGRWRVSGRS